MPTKHSYLLVDKNSQCIIHGQNVKMIENMLDFDAVAGRKTPSIAAILNPNRDGFHKVFFGSEEILIPMYTTIHEALRKHPNVDSMINCASFRSAFVTTLEALEQEQIQTITIIAEGIPERKMRILTATAKQKRKWIIGPSTVGGVVAGKFKIGFAGGSLDNIIRTKMYRPGSVGLVTVSGGMSNEMYNIISQATDGVYEGIAIGGDSYPGSTLVEHLLRYQRNPHIKMLVILGEVGGDKEYEVIQALKEGKITKPLVAWVTGTCAKEFTSEVQFGHAGARSGSDHESADAKNKALKKAGAIVPKNFNSMEKKIRETYQKLVKQGVVKVKEEKEIPIIPQNFQAALRDRKVRKSTAIISSISNDTGQEATYLGQPISRVVEREELNIGYVIGLLWFRKKLPAFACRYIEMILKTMADHGPAVSGAHNTIVATRAGKDLVSSLTSGLLTIGPRFGGAVDGAAKCFKDAFDRKLSPVEFVAEMKRKGQYIPGIGHRIKSIRNPDKRVEGLKKFVRKHFKKTPLLDYALEVEKVTTAKKGKLILNVDGYTAVSFIDMLDSVPGFTKKEINEAIDLGILNGLFILSRSIGLMGHHFDQKRLKQPLYRHPTDDILYLDEK